MDCRVATFLVLCCDREYQGYGGLALRHKLRESVRHVRDLSPVYTTIFLARYPFEFGPGA